MAVCSTPSSPLGPGVPGMVPLLKLRFTGVDGGEDWTERPLLAPQLQGTAWG